MEDINIVEQKATILDPDWYWKYCSRAIAYATRVAYRSSNIGQTPEERLDRDEKLFRRLLHTDNTSYPQHTSTFEHKNFSVEILTDRAIANEIIRHRHTAYTQESTRYVNMGNRKAEFIAPYGFDKMNDEERNAITSSYTNSYNTYLQLLKSGILPQHARDVLPLGLATTFVMSTNTTQWRKIFELRCDSGAHPKVRSLMLGILIEFNKKLPSVFGDLCDKFSGSDIVPCKVEYAPIEDYG